MRSPIPLEKQDDSYRRLWRIVDGAVADAFVHHPDYLAPRRRKEAQLSVVKRVVGAVIGFAEESAKGRACTPADKSSALHDDAGDSDALQGRVTAEGRSSSSQRAARAGRPASVSKGEIRR